MISTAFEYSRATSVDDAVAKLGAANGDAKLIAGGHSLVPLMKLRLSEPKLLIDIARIPGLAGIRQQGGTIEIGAATTRGSTREAGRNSGKAIARAKIAQPSSLPYGAGQPMSRTSRAHR